MAHVRRAVALVVAHDAGRRSNSTLLRSHRSSLRKTVISAGAAARAERALDRRRGRRSDSESPYRTKNASPSAGSARLQRAAGAEQRRRRRTHTRCDSPQRAPSPSASRIISPRCADAEDDVARRPGARASSSWCSANGRPATSTSAFGIVVGDRPQPRRQAAGQDRDRQAHANSTFVPSKSKRNRTSSRPAVAIAARRRR